RRAWTGVGSTDRRGASIIVWPLPDRRTTIGTLESVGGRAGRPGAAGGGRRLGGARESGPAARRARAAARAGIEQRRRVGVRDRVPVVRTGRSQWSSYVHAPPVHHALRRRPAAARHGHAPRAGQGV